MAPIEAVVPGPVHAAGPGMTAIQAVARPGIETGAAVAAAVVGVTKITTAITVGAGGVGGIAVVTGGAIAFEADAIDVQIQRHHRRKQPVRRRRSAVVMGPSAQGHRGNPQW